MQAIQEGEQFTASVPTSGGLLRVQYRVKHSVRARVVRLTLQYDNVLLLTLPRRVSLKRGIEFLQSQGDWVEAVMARAPVRVPLGTYLSEHPILSAAGKPVAVYLSLTEVQPGLVLDLKRGELCLRYRPGEEEEAQLKQLMIGFARAVIPPHVKMLAKQVGVFPERITVRDQRSRWGSCSGKKTLSLNWRLVLLPPELHDYIVYHELAHLREMNHSQAFWELLGRFDPDCESHDRLVSQLSGKLMALGRF